MVTDSEAFARVQSLVAQKRSKGFSQNWLFQQIDNLVRRDGASFYTEGEIWEMIDAFS
ncbi:hypothetical protein [Mesorhizobium sp. SP-1A]|uniref:hypothetical protein n=1 Tax=Mesorhizobium sp. SP-1A TaxID=3077840 RepID=UPI0028F73BC1|nr:hypothetical protein [Mesorhizobium sp. SP-1A]